MGIKLAYAFRSTRNTDINLICNFVAVKFVMKYFINSVNIMKEYRIYLTTIHTTILN